MSMRRSDAGAVQAEQHPITATYTVMREPMQVVKTDSLAKEEESMKYMEFWQNKRELKNPLKVNKQVRAHGAS